MSEQANTWRVKTMPGDNTHGYMALTPGCEGKPHPTRWCRCKVFRTMAQADQYIVENRDME